MDDTGTRGYINRKDDYLRRLRRIEGQARGLQRMSEEEKYCSDILTQVSAMTKASSRCRWDFWTSTSTTALSRPRPRVGARLTRRSRKPPTPSPGSFGPDLRGMFC